LFDCNVRFTLGDVVLNNVTEQIRECYRRAGDCAQKAAAQTDPKLKADFSALERRWLVLARSYDFTERLTNFPGKTKRRADSLRKREMPDTQRSILCPRCQVPMLWFKSDRSDDPRVLEHSYQCEKCGLVSQSNSPRVRDVAVAKRSNIVAVLTAFFGYHTWGRDPGIV
jgi:predicted RNA-binding Zn-ribbon protein involved in translation (DUF1610 family)